MTALAAVRRDIWSTRQLAVAAWASHFSSNFVAISDSELLRPPAPKRHKTGDATTSKTGDGATEGTSKEAGKPAASTSGEEIKALIRSTVLEVLRDIAPPTATSSPKSIAPSKPGKK